MTVAWRSSAMDFAGGPVTHYSSWRTVPGAVPAGKVARVARIGDVEYAWERVRDIGNETYYDVASHHLSHYSLTVPTLFDSSSQTDGLQYFMVCAHTRDSTVFRDSNAMGGYSVDNLAPSPPAGVVARYAEGEATITWRPGTDMDLQRYVIYRSDGPNAGMTGDPVLATTTDTIFVDRALPTGVSYYVVRAEDIHQNLSGRSNEVHVATTPTGMAGAEHPRSFTLRQNSPNPFNPQTNVQYSLSAAGAVRLSVFDNAGRLVRTLVEGERAVGVHEAT